MKAGIYESMVKPVLDKILAFMGLVVLSPLFVAISIAVFIDDPGKIFFTQKRIGKGKQYVMVHKFRSMSVSTPHDVPTHQLSNPDQYITKVGRVLRKTSLDELPQIWDIFRGRMSIVGPRPALWNQDDLIKERDKYGANDIMPGLTGLAQIKGRDELEIVDKAKLDGEYTILLHIGGFKAFLQDAKCIMGTVVSVIKHEGIVEGGTGEIKKKNMFTADKAGFEDYGFKKKFNIDKKRLVKVLITGAESYIGGYFAAYCKQHYPNIQTTTIDMKNESWREYDFSQYDTIFHVAGIAHADVGCASNEQKKMYYSVNTDLAIEVAEKAKASGVHQFIYMSSMIIYGGVEYIDEHTIPVPANFYGDSKLHGDIGVRRLGSDKFRVAVLRAPMIYGKGSKGNFIILSKLAKKLPLFPNYNNKRSVLYIENLCEFVSLLSLSGEGGIYFPQNGEYVSTSRLVREIGITAGNSIYVSRLLNPAVFILLKMPGKAAGLASKAFGSRYFSQTLSIYEGLSYQKIGLRESIIVTEGNCSSVSTVTIE